MSAPPATPAPGVLDELGLKRVVVVLSVVQITSWGVLYYAFAALQSSITADTGWSGVAVTGAFSCAQVVSGAAGIWVGRQIDSVGPRAVMTAGSLAAVPGVLLVALGGSLGWFYLGWVLVGLAMAGVLYPSAFAALTRWGGVRRLKALTTLTLVAGLASTVFVPVATALDGGLGWRGTYLILLAVLAVITIPLHWLGLDHPWVSAREDDDATPEPASPSSSAPSIMSSRPFRVLALANALAALTVFAVVINLVPMLVERGMSRNLAAVGLGLGGVGQVMGRLGYARFARATTVRARSVVVVLAVALTTAALAIAPGWSVLLILVGVLLGLARGIYTLVQATAVTDRWGAANYGSLNGVLTAPALFAAAVAPFVGAALADLLGSYTRAFLVLSTAAMLAAVLMLGSVPASSTTSSTRWSARSGWR